jgi:PhnB protein
MKINTYIRFNDDKCREGMAFYKNVLGGEKITFMTVAESPMAKEMDKSAQDKIMHAKLDLPGGGVLMGSDMMRDKAKIGDNVVMSLDCDSETQINEVFKKLSDGGEVFMPIEKAFWGAMFGMVTDKYGVEWMLNAELPKK